MPSMSDTNLLVSQKHIQTRAAELLEETRQRIFQRTDFMFAWLMLAQWFAGIIAAAWISPQTWIGAAGQAHWHIWAAILLGGAISTFPVFLAFKHPGETLTRHVVAVSQMLMSALLIHLTGGRIETHFHVFGSLAFLAFYRDWRVLVTATTIVALDHMARGLFWPQSVFGVLTASSWRWVEHAGWVLFEDAFLLLSIRHSLQEMSAAAAHRAGLEAVNAEIEEQVDNRTAELTAAHQELQFREERYRKLSESSPIGIFETDAGGQILYTNRCWQSIACLTLEESLKDGWQKAIHPEDADRVFSTWGNCVREGGRFDGEFRFHSPAGGDRWVHARSVVVRSPAGEITGHVGTTEDITERKLAQKKLAENEHRLRSILAAEPECVKLVDVDGNLLDMNPAGLTMIEADSLEQVVGHSCFGLIAPEYLARFRDLNTAVFRGESLITEFEIIGLKGTRRWMESHACPLRDAEGQIFAQLAVSRDVTARKKSEAELAQAQKELVEASRQAGMAEVATGVLHNVGNVLNSVNVASTCVADGIRRSKSVNIAKIAALLREHQADLGDFMSHDPKGKMIPGYLTQLAEHLDAEQTKALHELTQLQKNIEHIRDIITMQQSFATSSGLTEPVQLPELLEDALRMNATSLNRHDIRIVKEFEAVPVVTTQKHKVLQILVNLMRNAKHACEDSGRDDKQMTLRLMNGTDHVRISVTDNGVGIPPENLTRIFGHGFTTKKNGHGFGLHSGALAIKEMGGALKVHSDGVGKGATFTVELPVQPTEDYDV